MEVVVGRMVSSGDSVDVWSEASGIVSVLIWCVTISAVVLEMVLVCVIVPFFTCTTRLSLVTVSGGLGNWSSFLVTVMVIMG